MTKRIFNQASGARLKAAIAMLPGLKESLKASGRDLKAMPVLHVFGYGSLPDQPHYPPTSLSSAYLWGYSRDLCCKSIRSGTEEFPGLTLGLDQNKDGIVAGATLTYNNLDAEQLCEMLEELAKREIVKALPIYKFEMLEVEHDNGQKVMAITCVADPDAAGYFGRGLTALEKKSLSARAQEDVSVNRKAKIIAEANGYLPKSQRFATAKSYFDRFVRFPIERNPVSLDSVDLKKLSEVERHRMITLAGEQNRLLKLAVKIDYYRAQLKRENPDLAMTLEQTESMQLEAWRQKRKVTQAVKVKPPQHK